MTTKSPALRVRLDNIDYILAPPGPLDRSNLPLVPLIRIYGQSSLGKKACAVIHQVYPYFFIEYIGDLSPDQVVRYNSKLIRSLNHALAISLKRNPLSPKSKYVRSVILVKGIHFYGFHSSYSPFLKIYLCNPQHIRRAATIMQSGMVMQTRFRVFESHLSFALQFMCDFGLYGCGWVDFDQEVYQRCQDEDAEDIKDVILANNDETSVQFKTSPHYRQSRMALEVDVIAHQILNRSRLYARNLHHKLDIPAPPLPPEPLVPSVRELWDDERKRRNERGLDPSPVMPTDPSEGSRAKGGDWVAEANWWVELKERILRERDTSELTAESNGNWEGWVMTTCESVQSLWERPWRTWTADHIKHDRKLKQEKESALINPFESESKKKHAGEDDCPDDIDVDTTIVLPEEWDKEYEEGNRQDDAEEEEHFEDDILGELENPQSPQPVTDEDNEDPFADPDGPQDGLKAKEYTLPNLPNAIDSDSDEPPASLGENGHDVPISSHNEPSLLSNASKESASNYPIEQGQQTPPKQAVGELATSKENRRLRLAITRATVVHPSSKNVGKNIYLYAQQPPTSAMLLSSMEYHNIPAKIYQTAHYSDKSDAPERPREYAGLLYYIRGGAGLQTLDEWKTSGSTLGADDNGATRASLSLLDPEEFSGWEYAASPPSVKQVKHWLQLTPDSSEHDNNTKERSQIKGPTQANAYGLKNSPLVIATSKASRQKDQRMGILSLEIFASSCGPRLPDSNTNEIAVAFYSYHGSDNYDSQCRSIIVHKHEFDPHRLRDPCAEIVSNELELINRLIDVIIELDPDVVVGWEVQLSSWGYVHRRADQYGFDFAELIGRALVGQRSGGIDQWGLRKTSTFKVVGRHVINLWRVMRSEFALSIYSFENVVFQLLGRRCPRYSAVTLTRWYRSDETVHVAQLMKYLSARTIINIDILEVTEFVSKNEEFARVFGVDFFSVLSRGSQFKVESFMLRIAKPESFVLISPSKADVGKQNAAECMPLIMEPVSAFYTSPLLVLDFQSLYPSVMIAYNYCYSTSLGRIQDFQGRPKFGVTELPLPNGTLEKLEPYITVAPNGIMYVKPTVRHGLLGRMLKELLDTRVMVKTAMKDVKDDKSLQRVLNARQLGLKYIANVTYGYTGATYSGRMPAVEIADSIVQSGREILEAAVRTIELTPKWGAKVVYGDTDSLFVYLQGKTKEQAFQIGNDIAEHITILNPAPIKLKFEKVYLPCVLMAKKRYVGFKYEALHEQEPVFDAKGIETVRRDGVPAQQKMVENCLKILFRSQDLSEVKRYCWTSWMKILEDRASVQDFIFAKEVKLGTYSDKGPPPPGAVVAARRLLIDENDEAQYGERVPYVITRGDPGTKLVDRAVAPMELLDDPQMHLDSTYYITRVLIPPLERVFNLVGADVRAWYDEMPRMVTELDVPMSPSKKHAAEVMNQILDDKLNIDEHFSPSQCIACGDHTDEVICEDCQDDPIDLLPRLMSRLHAGEMRLAKVQAICMSCTGTPPGEPIACESLDCPWLYERKKAWANTEVLENIRDIVDELFETHSSRSGSEEGEADLEVKMEVDSETDDWLSTPPPPTEALPEHDSASTGPRPKRQRKD